jgi:ribosomal protein L29
MMKIYTGEELVEMTDKELVTILNELREINLMVRYELGSR